MRHDHAVGNVDVAGGRLHDPSPRPLLEERHETVAISARSESPAIIAAASRLRVLRSGSAARAWKRAIVFWRVSSRTNSWKELPVRAVTRSSSSMNGALPRYCGAITS
jgi:hypothetical protein